MNKRWLVLALVAGCADPMIEMSLRLPSASQIPANFDLSCISTVEVATIGHDQGTFETPADVSVECVDLPQAPTSFADIRAAIAGRFEFPIPASGLAAIDIRGTRGSCADKVREYEANFYGGAVYLDGADNLTIPVVPNISCNQRQTYTVTPIDLLALTSTRECAPITPNSLVFAGNLRPQMLGPEFSPMTFEDGQSAISPSAATGTALIDSYASATNPRSCIAMGFASNSGFAGSCINPGAATLCASPGELELATINDVYAGNSIETAMVQEYGEPVFGAVWKQSAAVAKVPVAGATVELEDPSQGKVVYVTPGPNKLVPSDGATSTEADGMFMIYLKGEATTLIVRQGGSQQRLTVASSGDLPATVLAVLP